jgi:ubiquinone/menaquinone biosynthesis C-methylase UbiE
MKEISVSARLKANYDEYYEGQLEWRALGAIDKANNIISLCRRHPHATLLDIGAGEGALLNRLSESAFGDRLHALEISETGVEIIRQRNIKGMVECKLFDGYNIPYEDNQFDLAILSHVVEHLEYPRRLLYEASRVAKHLFVEVPLEDNFRLKPDFVFDRVGHINFYSPKTIRRLIQTCDLEVLSQVVTNPSCKSYEFSSGRKGVANYLIKELTLRVAPRVAPSLWTYHCSLVCQKKAV